jgi:hypothetical protein
MIRNILLTLFIIITFTCGFSQSCSDSNYLKTAGFYSTKFDSILNIAFIKVKTAYPDLKDIRIIIEQKKINTIMAARPKIAKFFSLQDKHCFQIIISNNPKNNCQQLFTQMPEDALVGILGHEFAHLLTYSKMSTIQMAFHGISYLFNKGKIERATDLITINHGLGDKLLDYNNFILESKLVSEQYLENRNNNYLSIIEIQNCINK